MNEFLASLLKIWIVAVELMFVSIVLSLTLVFFLEVHL